MTTRILLIEDSPLDRELTRHALHRLPCPPGPVELCHAGEWNEAWPQLIGRTFDLVLLDYNLPGLSGLEVLAELRRHTHPPVVMITGQGDLATAVETLRAGAYDYVVKAADWGPALCLTIERVLARAALERELAESRVRLAAHNAELERQVNARTALVQAQAAEIEALYLRTEETARLKSEIVANVSHELRTPLNSVLGYADLLGDQVETGEARRLLAKLRGQAERLSVVVNSILTVGRLRAGGDAVRVQRFALDALLGELRAEALALSTERRLTIDCVADTATITQDREKLRAIGYHLLSNAIKFTPDGGTVTLMLTPTAGDGLRLAVRDTGVGLPPLARAVIFEDFRQLDGSTTRHFEGLGLGLGIVKRYTALLRGTLTVASAPNQGTTITIDLPAPLAERAAEGVRAVPPPSARALRS